MAEYIERAELMKFPIRIDHYDKEHGNVNFVYGVETVLEYAKNIPAADVVERSSFEAVGNKYAQIQDKLIRGELVHVVHGRWIPDGNTVCCSECKTMGSPQWKGCPVCLARMDGE